MYNKTDIAWAAGLLEGEGYFRVRKNEIAVMCHMTDFDVLESLKEKIGGTIHGPYKRPGNRKDSARWALSNKFQVYAFIVAIYQFMGTRRKQRIREMIRYFHNMRYGKKPFSVKYAQMGYTGFGLTEFAKEHNLDPTRFGQLVAGKIDKYKGWTNEG